MVDTGGGGIEDEQVVMDGSEEDRMAIMTGLNIGLLVEHNSSKHPSYSSYQHTTMQARVMARMCNNRHPIIIK